MHPAPDTKPILASLQPQQQQQQNMQQMRNVELQQPQPKQEVDDSNSNGITSQQRIKLGSWIVFATWLDLKLFSDH